MTAAIKAYVAHHWEGEHSVIVFGTRNSMALRREAAGQMDGDVESIDSMVRAPDFDEFAADGRTITAQDYIERGWHFQCASCQCRVVECMEEEPDFEEGDEILDGPAYHPLHPHEVWCSSSCRDKHRERRFRKKVEACNEHVEARDAALKRWPGITVRSISRRHYDKPETLEVGFTFPGMTGYGQCTWVYGAPTMNIPHDQGDNYDAYRATIVSPDRDPGDEHRAPGSIRECGQ